jgi:hypothetical protein
VSVYIGRRAVLDVVWEKFEHMHLSELYGYHSTFDSSSSGEKLEILKFSCWRPSSYSLQELPQADADKINTASFCPYLNAA